MLGHAAIVIDDKQDDGLAVAQTLWNKGQPCLFFEYSPEALHRDIQKQTGIRVIFLDICLLGGSSPGVKDYDQAVFSIEKLLSPNNGPWLMATWSTWEGEHAPKLFEHLRANLPRSIHPFNYICLEKGDLAAQGPGSHSEVKPLEDSDIESLYQKCVSEMSKFPSFSAISGWETTSCKSAQKVVHDITTVPLALSPTDFDKSLGSMLFKVGEQEVGRPAAIEHKASGATQVLNNLAASKSALSESIPSLGLYEVVPSEDVAAELKREWSRRTNKVLHFEDVTDTSCPPGMVYHFKKPSHYYTDEGNLRSELESFYDNEVLKKQLLDELEDHPAYGHVVEASHLVLVDVTPPCDHVNKKAQWRKFVVGVQIIASPNDLSSKSKIHRFFSKLTKGNRWQSPCYSIADDENSEDIRFFYLDLRLVVSVPDDEHFLGSLVPICAFKDQLSRALVSSLVSHMARPGILDMAR